MAEKESLSSTHTVVMCSKCGSTEVEVRACVNPNDNNSFAFYCDGNVLEDVGTCYCHNCCEWTKPVFEQGKELIAGLEQEKPNFAIAFLDRSAIIRNGFRAEDLSDNDMVELAGMIGDSYCGSSEFDNDLQDACEEFGLERFPCCPRCGDSSTISEIGINAHLCNSCSQKWTDAYTLVENPEETDQLPDDLGYPSSEASNSNARYITEYDYIRIFGKEPEPNSYYEPVCWPESQKYMPDDGYDGDPAGDSIDALNELINDEKGLADFGENAIWIPLCNLK